MNYKSKITQNKKISKETEYNLYKMEREAKHNFSVMRRKVLKSSAAKTWSREENVSLQEEQAKVLGTHCYWNWRTILFPPPNSHTLFPQVSSCDNRLPWDNKGIVCYSRERLGQVRDGKCFEEVIGTMNCWDANKFNYLSYRLVSMLLGESQILKHKNVHRPFPYKS